MAVFICQGCGAEHSSWEGKCPNCSSTETIRLHQPTDRMADKVVKGKWKIVRKLGQGGMGAVYLAEQVGIGHRVALKFLKSEFSSDPELARRFLNEAKSYARVSHPNAVTLHDFGQDEEGNLFIAMEYCEGVDLKKVIAEQGRLPVVDAVEVVLQVADVLATAHTKGVIHRDLKPENIMIRRGMRGVHAKVLDFGIARLMGEGTRLTVQGAIAGTPRYMSPEQVEGKEIDHRADIYALGIVLFEALTGKQPFDGATIAEILRKQVVEPMPHLAEAASDLDYPEVDAVIQKACAKAREERFPDFLTFASALSQALPTQAHLSVPPLQRSALSQVTATPTAPAGAFTAQATPQPRGGATASASAPWTLKDQTAATVVRQPTAVPGQTETGPGAISPAAGAAAASVVVAPEAAEALPRSKAPWIVLAVAVVVGGGAAGFFALGPKVDTGVAPPPDPQKPPLVVDVPSTGAGGATGTSGTGGTTLTPGAAGGNGTAPGVVVDEALKQLREAGALNSLTAGRAEYDKADLGAAQTSLKSVTEGTSSWAEAQVLLKKIAAIEEKLGQANRLRASGQCEAALPLYQDVLRLNGKVADAVKGVAFCRESAVNPTME